MFDHFEMPALLSIIAFIVVIELIFTVVPFWFIFKKAGYHPALSLLMIIPFIDVAIRFYLAFSDWPVMRRVQDLERKPVQ